MSVSQDDTPKRWHWFEGGWVSVADGFHTATTDAFGDWPLWLSIPIGIGVPWFLIWMMTSHVHAMQNQVATFSGILHFGVATTICAYVSYDAWFQMSIFKEGEKGSTIMRIGYPMLTSTFGFAFIFDVFSRLAANGRTTTRSDLAQPQLTV
mgnify:CR=1 FL=1